MARPGLDGSARNSTIVGNCMYAPVYHQQRSGDCCVSLSWCDRAPVEHTTTTDAVSDSMFSEQLPSSCHCCCTASKSHASERRRHPCALRKSGHDVGCCHRTSRSRRSRCRSDRSAAGRHRRRPRPEQPTAAWRVTPPPNSWTSDDTSSDGGSCSRIMVTWSVVASPGTRRRRLRSHPSRRRARNSW